MDSEAADAAADASPDVAGRYAAAADDCHIFCRKVDKKREKAVVQEQRADRREHLKALPPTDAAQVCRVGLQLALLQDNVPGLLFPADMWALRLVAQSLRDAP